MRVVLCLDGANPDHLLEAALPLVPAGTVWLPVYVIDARPRADLGILRAGIPGAGPLPTEQRQQIEAAGEERANAVVAAAEQALDSCRMLHQSAIVRIGEPGRAICSAAADAQADLVVLFARRRPAARLTGPPSVGHTARFVVDHSPCPVLLLRRAAVPRG